MWGHKCDNVWLLSQGKKMQDLITDFNYCPNIFPMLNGLSFKILSYLLFLVITLKKTNKPGNSM